MGGFIELKTTFEACIGLFSLSEHENIGSRLMKGCHAEAALHAA